MPRFLWLNLQTRLIGDLLIFVLLLAESPSRAMPRVRAWVYCFAAVFFALLTFSNLRGLNNRAEDFRRRIVPAPSGYGTFSVSSVGDRLVLDEMTEQGYVAVTVPEGDIEPPSLHEDILGIAAAREPKVVYVEAAGERTRILRLPLSQTGQSGGPDQLVNGYDPSVSPDGRWLAYLTDTDRTTSIHLLKDGIPVPVRHSERIGDILEMSLSSDGILIFASGGAANPYLSVFDPVAGTVRRLVEIGGGVRYPAGSPGGKWLAFSRRESGAWHLFVRDLEGGGERRLTWSACNATSPSWEDSRTLVYVSDCGRGLGLGAPVRLDLSK